MIAEVLRSGAHQSPDEAIKRTLELLHEQECKLSENRTQIEKGYTAAPRGELIDGDEVRARLEEPNRGRVVQHRVGFENASTGNGCSLG